MVQYNTEKILRTLSNRLMEFRDYRNNPHRNEVFHQALTNDDYVTELIHFAEIKLDGEDITEEDVNYWREVFSKLLLLEDGIVHTQLELDILEQINSLLGKITSFIKVRYYDNHSYINYAISAENQNEILHNHQDESSEKTWMWFVRYGNRTFLNHFEDYAQFNVANAALAFHVKSIDEIDTVRQLVENEGFVLNTVSNPALELSTLPCWVNISSISDVDKLKKAIRFCFQRRLNDCVTMIFEMIN